MKRTFDVHITVEIDNEKGNWESTIVGLNEIPYDDIFLLSSLTHTFSHINNQILGTIVNYNEKHEEGKFDFLLYGALYEELHNGICRMLNTIGKATCSCDTKSENLETTWVKFKLNKK